MKKIKFLIYILCTIMTICAFPLFTVSAKDDDLGLSEFPDIKSRYIVVMDADSGEVLYSNNPDEKCYPASTTKILTALLTIENSSPSDTITFSENAVKSIEYGDANAGIKVGEQMTIEQALYCLLLRSANDVAYGLAEYIGTSQSAFATMMNERANSLGAVNTHFSNASGLTDQFHYTTPYDMSLIAKECFNNKALMKIMAFNEVYTIGPTNTSNYTRYYKSRYEMLPGATYGYKYSLGGKTGYTDAAQSCLVSFAQKDDLRLICTIMNSTDSARYEDTTALFDYYFNNYKKLYLSDTELSLYEDSIDILSLTGDLAKSDKFTLSFKDNAYILIPRKLKMGELTTLTTYADNVAYSGDTGGFACISFFYKNTDIGHATVFLNAPSSQDILPGSNGVSSSDITLKNKSDDIFFINIIYVFAFVAICLLLFFLIRHIIKRKHRRRFSFKNL